ncbi:MAG: tRNA (adenosine(37)-N6)-threonylcarbamoyltransferase complex dimerization subunit type 1 TsaB [Desulfocapsaceae bacterium]|nr:tRNA (adenosine(37)-N6)-threonylcarbamoyltransferase complex dimerization subunit type 1 TsaB [Desulfocapsaceae bacterium]
MNGAQAKDGPVSQVPRTAQERPQAKDGPVSIALCKDGERSLPLILAIDTASSCSAVALTRGSVVGGQVVASLSLNSNVTHSRRLLAAINWLFNESGTEWQNVDGLAVSLGPGSFTGLRIGMATAKGLITATQKPLLGVSTLDALALNCSGERLICAVLDARKKEVYTCFYRYDTEGIPRRDGTIRVLSPQRLAEEIQQPVLFVGDAVMLYGELWQEALGTRFASAPRTLHYPCASALGLLAGEMLQQDQCLDPDSAAPLYVRASDAELSLGAVTR